MRWLKNRNIFPMRARFANVIIGVGSFWERGAERCLNNSCGTQKLVHGGGYRSGHTAVTGQLILGSEGIGLLTRSMPAFRILNLQHDSTLNPNMLEKPSAIGHTFGKSIRHEHSVSREWLAKRWAEEKRRKDIMRKRKRRYAQRVETKEPMLDASFKFPFMQPFFTRTTPVEQRWQTHEASVQPPITEEGFLDPQTPEEANINSLSYTS